MGSSAGDQPADRASPFGGWIILPGHAAATTPRRPTPSWSAWLMPAWVMTRGPDTGSPGTTTSGGRRPAARWAWRCWAAGAAGAAYHAGMLAAAVAEAARVGSPHRRWWDLRRARPRRLAARRAVGPRPPRPAVRPDSCRPGHRAPDPRRFDAGDPLDDPTPGRTWWSPATPTAPQAPVAGGPGLPASRAGPLGAWP